MFGKNAVTKPYPRGDGSLTVHSIWYTIQGEGPDAGRPAIFIRLSKCNLRCHFCDTEFETGEVRNLHSVMSEVERLRSQGHCNLVVITGGEPFLQNIIPLTILLNEQQIQVSVETAGSVYLAGLEDLFASNRSMYGNLIVCSPKTPTLDHRVIPLIGALKYITKQGECDPDDGLPTMSTQVAGRRARIYRPSANLSYGVPIYLQPMDEQDSWTEEHGSATARNAKEAARLCMEYGYRLSIQLHKIVGLD